MEHLADLIATALEEKGWCILDGALPEPVAAVAARVCADAPTAAFRPAGIGRRDDYQRDVKMRSDAIRWLDTSTSTDTPYLMQMDSLRTALNSRLFLGLFDYECHYARYAPGAFYGKHRDAFMRDRNRVLSTVLYLNADWRKEEGGELLLYAADDASKAFEEVLPQYNRLVLFLSARFPHEVKPATRVRHSIAGWFRVRS